jgi:hypothetical protein
MFVSVGETWTMRRRASQALGACPLSFSAFGKEEDGRRLQYLREELRGVKVDVLGR